jgi:tryptophan 7-halogenase
MIEPIRKLCIVGGGTAGWIAAAVMAQHFRGRLFEIELVESDDIGTIGVGESTVPPFLELLAKLGINEQLFIKEVQASFKLGIEFRDWRALGESYFHPFGTIGGPIGLTDFYQAWLKARATDRALPLQDYAAASVMAREGRFMLPFKARRSPISGASYALHVDAKRVAHFLRRFSEDRGVKRTEGIVEDVRVAQSGFVEELVLTDGRRIAADFFIDCSGFRALLIGKALGVGYHDWSHLLFCDRAIAAQTENEGDPPPYTLAHAQEFGWRWRIPLQHRTGNGHVFCSRYLSDDEATHILLSQVAGPVVAGPITVPFRTGVREKIWHKNVLSIGLSAGFIEPLESTAIHLIYRGMDFFFRYLPDRNCDPRLIAEYNRRMIADYEEIRDFIILHYCTTERCDTGFWKECRELELPESLRAKLDLFRAQGALREGVDELFRSASWQSVMEGMGVRPATYNPAVDIVPFDEMAGHMERAADELKAFTQGLPSHAEFLRTHCPAVPPEGGTAAMRSAAG